VPAKLVTGPAEGNGPLPEIIATEAGVPAYLNGYGSIAFDGRLDKAGHGVAYLGFAMVGAASAGLVSGVV